MNLLAVMTKKNQECNKTSLGVGSCKINYCLKCKMFIGSCKLYGVLYSTGWYRICKKKYVLQVLPVRTWFWILAYRFLKLGPNCFCVQLFMPKYGRPGVRDGAAWGVPEHVRHFLQVGSVPAHLSRSLCRRIICQFWPLAPLTCQVNVMSQPICHDISTEGLWVTSSLSGRICIVLDTTSCTSED
jgi:hypothetical protein